MGVDIAKLATVVSETMEIVTALVIAPLKERRRAVVRSLITRRTRISQLSNGISIQRGEQIGEIGRYSLLSELKL